LSFGKSSVVLFVFDMQRKPLSGVDCFKHHEDIGLAILAELGDVTPPVPPPAFPRPKRRLLVVQ